MAGDTESCEGESYPALSDQVILATQITASILCVLSILGASLIIFTYVAFKKLRTIARQLLVSLSVADIIIAVSHFIGLFTNYRRFIVEDENGVKVVSNSSYNDTLCVTQGAFSIFGTVASLLFSVMIAFYLLVLTQSKSMRPARLMLPFIYVIGWGVPLVIVAFLAGWKAFGFEPIANAGWCYTSGKSSIHEGGGGVLADVLSYELWALLCFILLTILYVSLFISKHFQCKACRKSSSPVGYGLAKGDIKLLFVPLIFFLLRIWSSVIDAGIYYTNATESSNFKCSKVTAVIAVLAGIGLNAQGFANAILFCAFTKQVREQLKESSKQTWLRLKLCCAQCLCCCKNYSIISEEERAKLSANKKEEYKSLATTEEKELICTLSVST